MFSGLVKVFGVDSLIFSNCHKFTYSNSNSLTLTLTLAPPYPTPLCCVTIVTFSPVAIARTFMFPLMSAKKNMLGLKPLNPNLVLTLTLPNLSRGGGRGRFQWVPQREKGQGEEGYVRGTMCTFTRITPLNSCPSHSLSPRYERCHGTNSDAFQGKDKDIMARFYGNPEEVKI